MRIGIVAWLQESNTFIAQRTTLAHFERHLLETGDGVREALAGVDHEVGGFFAGLEREGLEAVPIFAARALPFGTLADQAHAELRGSLLTALAKAGPLDGILAAPHGATVSESVQDVDGDWLGAVRMVVGTHAPIIATADSHGNLSERMLEAVNGLIAYRTNPHLDQRERGLEAANLMARTLRGEVRPVVTAVRLPMVISIDRQCTCEEPCREISRLVDAVRRSPGVLSASWFLGFPYADVAEMGTSFVVVADGDAALAREHAEALGRSLWDRRCEFEMDLPEVDEALARARNMPAPVLLLDVGDNVGGGAPGDGTALARACLQQGVGPAFVCLHDPDAVRQAETAGVGRTLPMSIGGKSDPRLGPPLQADVTVETVADGRFEEPEPRHGGIRHFDQGRTAIVKTQNGLVVMLTSKRMVPFSLHQLTDFGLDPSVFRVLIAKGVNAPLAAYQTVCPGHLRVNTPGPTTADLSRLDYRNRRRPMFPFEAEAAWQSAVGSRQ